MDKLVTLGLVERFKNRDFILVTELNQNQNSKQTDRPDPV